MADGRGRTLALAVEAGLTGETGAISGLFADDVSGWSPQHVGQLAGRTHRDRSVA